MDGAISLLEQNTILLAAVESRVVLVSDSRVDHSDVVLVMLVEVVDNLADFVKRESLRVKSKDPAVVHVIDISPHSLQGNLGN